MIVVKAAYLIQRGIRQPDEILLLAFSKGATAEIADRIEERSGATVDAMTFHALGYGIIRDVEGGTPALAAHASDDAEFGALLRDILFNDLAKVADLGSLPLKWFSNFYWPYKSEWDFKTQHADARIFAVDDDWQSIYRFTGSDIHLMRNFGREFGGTFAGQSGVHSLVDLGRTFRSVDKIALPTRKFVLQNPSQIKKQVIPAGTTDAPAIKVGFYACGKEEHELRNALADIQAVTDGAKATVLLLGRYRFVKPDGLSKLSTAYPRISVRFMIVHGSKGLEADHVIILRASNNRMGFPSQIVDDLLLDLVLPKPEGFDHAEERRLFYVALTRARKSVTVLAGRQKPSVFARELVDNPAYETVLLCAPNITEHKCGVCGGRMLAQTSKKGSLYFRCEHGRLCKETLSPCDACGTDLPALNKANAEQMLCNCGAEYLSCPECADGWLVERKGQFGKFFGCVNYPRCMGKKQPKNKLAKA